MNWLGYVVRGIVFVAVFTLLGVAIFSAPPVRMLISGTIAAIIWLILGHYIGIFKRPRSA